MFYADRMGINRRREHNSNQVSELVFLTQTKFDYKRVVTKVSSHFAPSGKNI